MKQRLSIIVLGGLIMLGACSAKPPVTIGLKDNMLAKCPDKPNCVSSTATDKEHGIAPLIYTGDMELAKQRLLSVIKGMKRTKIVTNHNTYLHVEFTSRLFRFVDDVEFLFSDEEKTIHLRSASRIGYSDLGANRKRIEKIREAFSSAR